MTGVDVSIVAGGSRGDHQGLVALALRLQAEGLRVRVIANSALRDWAASLGADVMATGDTSASEVLTDSAQRIHRGAWPLSLVHEIVRAKPGVQRQLDEIADLTANTRLIVCSEASSLAMHAADLHGVACVYVRFVPVWPTGAWPAPVVRAFTLGAALNRLSHVAFSALMGVSAARDVNAWRHRRHLPAWSFTRPEREVVRRRWPVMIAASRVLLGEPRDLASTVQLTGNWFLDEPGELPLHVREFLGAHRDRPVVFAIGSITGPRAERGQEQLARLLPTLDRPSIVTGTWAAPDLAARSERILLSGPIPHRLLFPHAAAVIHTCGAGITGEALRAGVASVPLPLHGEQQFWARRLAHNGLASRALHWKRITPTAFHSAIDQAVTLGGGERLRAARAAVLGEAGVAAGARAVHRLLDTHGATIPSHA